MTEPWFPNPDMFGALYGSIAGGLGGSLAGVWGAAAGALAPQGKGRPWILGGFYVFFGFGLINLLVGIVALVGGQPYAIWYPLLLCGAIFSIVTGCLIPVIRRRYEEAEQRRLEAEDIRHTT